MKQLCGVVLFIAAVLLLQRKGRPGILLHTRRLRDFYDKVPSEPLSRDMGNLCPSYLRIHFYYDEYYDVEDPWQIFEQKLFLFMSVKVFAILLFEYLFEKVIQQ